jgi:predicted dinucleotide-binding enzyme
MKIGVLGSGAVAKVLASGFLAHGHEVVMGTRDRQKLAAWSAQNPEGSVGAVADAAAHGEVLVLAVKGLAAADVLRAAGSGLAGKVVLDATNPIADTPPVHGVIKYFTTLDESLMERLQQEFPAARLVKAFSCVGNALMVNPRLPGGKPTMFICGNDPDAKRIATAILDQFGWDSEDMGRVEAARAIEPLAILWCIPGFLRNEWMHAFKLVRS